MGLLDIILDLPWVGRVRSVTNPSETGGTVSSSTAAGNAFIADVLSRRMKPGVGGNPHRMVEMHGGTMLYMSAFEPDPTTFRDEYYYNVAKNVLYRKVVTENNPKNGRIVAHWRSASQLR